MIGQNRESIIIGTRGSALALWQAEWVAGELRRRHAGLEVRLERIIAPADAAPDIPIAQIGTKGLYTKTLEDALLAGRIDARGKNVVIVLSGGNVDADLFARLVA